MIAAHFPRRYPHPLAKFEVIGDVRSCFGENEAGNHILTQVGMKHRRFGADAKFGSRTGCQNFIFHFDQVEGLLGDLLADRRHTCDRISHIAHTVAAEDEAVLQVQPNIAGKILPGDDSFHTGKSLRLA